MASGPQQACTYILLSTTNTGSLLDWIHPVSWQCPMFLISPTGIDIATWISPLQLHTATSLDLFSAGTLTMPAFPESSLQGRETLKLLLSPSLQIEAAGYNSRLCSSLRHGLVAWDHNNRWAAYGGPFKLVCPGGSIFLGILLRWKYLD